jgi:hypothetical protein
MDLERWLRDLGLGQYEASFRESEIGRDILPDLTENDLEKLGVPIGHRKPPLKLNGTLGTIVEATPSERLMDRHRRTRLGQASRPGLYRLGNTLWGTVLWRRCWRSPRTSASHR